MLRSGQCSGLGGPCTPWCEDAGVYGVLSVLTMGVIRLVRACNRICLTTVRETIWSNGEAEACGCCPGQVD